MEEKQNYTTPPYEEEEEGIDIVALIRSMWEGRKTIIICTAVFIVLGLVAALTMKRIYSVSSVMVPQLGSSRNTSLSSLASLAGFDLGSASLSSSELSPLVYPQIVNSVPFRKELIYTPLHYEKVDTTVSLFTYAMEYSKPSVISVVLKYTIGLPGVIIKAIRGEKPEIILEEAGEGEDPAPLYLTEDEEDVIKEFIDRNINLAVDKKEGYLTLSVKGSEPLQTAELALKAQHMLQDNITRFRTEKAQNQLDYVQARYNEIKKEAESYQAALAAVTDRSQNMTTSRARIERERLQSKYNIANSVYLEMAKQLETAKMQVKQDTPVLTIIQPVTIPTKSSNSRARTLIVWTFLGFVLGCGLVLGKGYLPKVKEMFSRKEEDEDKN